MAQPDFSIKFESITRNTNGDFVLKTRREGDFAATIIDSDGKILLLNCYLILVQNQVDQLYSGNATWSQIKFNQVNDFSKLRPIFKLAMQKYIQKHKHQNSAKELAIFLNLPWIKKKTQNPTWDELTNQTIGYWLNKNIIDLKTNVLLERFQKNGKSVFERYTLPLFKADSRYAMNSYYSARPLTLPPESLQKTKSEMVFSKEILNMASHLQ